MSDNLQRWVAVVYDGEDKVSSHIFRGSDEDEVRPEATKWVERNFGEKRDWSLHHVVEK